MSHISGRFPYAQYRRFLYLSNTTELYRIKVKLLLYYQNRLKVIWKQMLMDGRDQDRSNMTGLATIANLQTMFSNRHLTGKPKVSQFLCLVRWDKFNLAPTHAQFKCTQMVCISTALKLFRNLRQFKAKPQRLVTLTGGQAVVMGPRTNGKK